MHIQIIGSGNLATNLVLEFHRKEIVIDAIVSANYENALQLSSQVNSKAYRKVEDLPETCDLRIIAVPDSVIPDIINKLSNNIPVVHTSGATNLDVFPKEFFDCGVIYPLQTFSKSKTIPIETIPFFIESRSVKMENILHQLSLKLNPLQFKPLSSTERLKLHVAAVFACNFSNYMYTLSAQIMSENKLPFDLLKPLVETTFLKAFESNPSDNQTGPAKRNDLSTISAHMQLLEENQELKEVYAYISNQIIKKYH